MKKQLNLESLKAFTANQPSDVTLFTVYGGYKSTDHDESSTSDSSDNHDTSTSGDSSTTADDSTSGDTSTYSD